MDQTRIEESSKYSGSHEFVMEWENKYNQQLGKEFENGVEPSKGQQQKLALARTIYRDALVMVLDEPTASIDALSETQIFEAMEKAAGQNTLIVITHRFNTTQNLDKIIVIERGEIVETGTHKGLIKMNGRYKEMFDSQAKAFREEVVSGETTPAVKASSKPRRARGKLE
jgi:ATP-binding cassette subfamily B protein